MLFTRTYRYRSAHDPAAIREKLLGKHVQIHNLDFEIYEKDDHIKIIPHAEQIQAIKSLPITHVELENSKGGDTRVVIMSKMRKIDQGGPMLIVMFCLFMFIGGIVAFTMSEDSQMYTYTLLGISVFLFTVFWVRMELGYFDYVRKIRDYVRSLSVN